MDKNIWVDPHQSRILGGMFPLSVLLKKAFAQELFSMRTLFHDLRERRFPVITWSQRRQAAQIESVMPELAAVFGIAREMSDAGVMLVGHSRGGLIGRKYLSSRDETVRGLITISTPHQGSSMAKFARYAAPVAALLSPLLPEHDKSKVMRSLRRIRDFLGSRALQELLPDSGFFQTLHDGRREGICYISAGGTYPELLSISSISFPGVFEKIIPKDLYPAELRMGEGDGLVSIASARIPWADEHFSFACNHAMILFDREARDALLNAIERYVSSSRQSAVPHYRDTLMPPYRENP
jgi:pimeloyl-ACP methyl ester carboxylesterase